MAFITNWVTNKASEYAKMGLQAGGSMAGNAVGGVGSMMENAGRNAGGSVTGGIGGVGGYINNYGESIKRSMSSDGPVSSGGGQKKTAVKPSGAVGGAQKAVGGAQQKALPAAGGAGKALSGAGGAARGVGSSAQKTASSAAPRPGAPKPNGISKPSPPSANTRSATSGPKPAYKTPANNANGAASNPRMGQQTNKVQNRTTDGKTKVSAASRPGAMKTASKPPVKGMDPKKHNAKDPLGVGVK